MTNPSLERPFGDRISVFLRHWVLRHSSFSCPLVGLRHVRHVLTEGRGQINLVILFLHQDLANLLSERVLAQRLTLPDTLSVVSNRLVLVRQVEPEHVLG